MKKVYSGYLTIDDYGDNYDSLMLVDDFADGLFSDIGNDCDKYGRYLKFRYYISDKEFDLKDIEKYLIQSYFGLSEIKIEACGCPTCGYMCVDKAVVGGHDIYEELLTFVGKFAIIEIDYYKTKKDFIRGMNG